MTKGIVVAGTASSAGKTTVTLGLMAALKARGFIIQPFKAGPDYIDPGYHSALLGRSSYNLDTWMCGAEAVVKTYRRMSAGADLSIVEGVMGLFDGRFARGRKAADRSCAGSTAHLAKVLKRPVLLVVDAKSVAASAGAIVKGFCDFDPELGVKYVIFNRVGSDRHAEILKNSIKGMKGVTLLGCVRREEKLKMPSRHLGLVIAADIRRGRWKGFVEAARKAVEEGVDIDRLIRLLRLKPAGAKGGKVAPSDGGAKKGGRKATDGVRIAVALDAAFCFYYAENLDSLVKAGAKLLYFSPIKSKRLPRKIDGLYLGGGYPELHAAGLEENLALRREIKASAESGMPVLAECGGFIYLCDSLKVSAEEGAGRAVSEMAGLFPYKVEMTSRRTALGYREVVTAKGFPFLPSGAVIRGHEYRYSRIKGSIKRAREPVSGNAFVEKGRGGGPVGFLYKRVVASYIHLHFASNPALAPGLLSACKDFRAGSGRRR